jgi:hypothetical protein
MVNGERQAGSCQAPQPIAKGLTTAGQSFNPPILQSSNPSILQSFNPSIIQSFNHSIIQSLIKEGNPMDCPLSHNFRTVSFGPYNAKFILKKNNRK